ncbi:phage tail protein [Actinomadura spongiicola]|uniref:Phage tail protein n=1 Tax=Actinomadura spongiicola TaxID=2303421 RepID=A0A372GDL9_9ACTN|nr:phage tail protein [Actinomadura spongiicola]RFS83464.1 phage tail protein [Actinomadura spongiicola]
MRGAVDGLLSPLPLGPALPSVFAEDDLIQRYVTGLDDLFAPLLSVLDCLEAYFSPDLAPMDFVGWLAGWVGAELHGEESERQARGAVAAATALHRMRGTRRGLAAAVRMGFGVTPEIAESGGAAWSERPRGEFPGDREPRLEVFVRVPDPSTVDVRRLDALVGAVRPAHVPYAVHVVKKGAEQ